MQIDRPNRRARFSAAGTLTPEEAAELAVGALSAAVAESLRALVLDFASMSLTRRMSVTECHEVGERLAAAGASLARVAFVTGAECAEHHAFLFTVATNRGLRAATFRQEADALGWLQAA